MVTRMTIKLTRDQRTFLRTIGMKRSSLKSRKRDVKREYASLVRAESSLPTVRQLARELNISKSLVSYYGRKVIRQGAV